MLSTTAPFFNKSPLFCLVLSSSLSSLASVRLERRWCSARNGDDIFLSAVELQRTVAVSVGKPIHFVCNNWSRECPSKMGLYSNFFYGDSLCVQECIRRIFFRDSSRKSPLLHHAIDVLNAFEINVVLDMSCGCIKSDISCGTSSSLTPPTCYQQSSTCGK